MSSLSGKLSSLLLSLVCLSVLGVSALAQNSQPMPDKVVGWWTSSSGTPLTISYSGDAQKVWLSINDGPNIDVWLAGGRDGRISLDYTTADGDKVHGRYNESNDTISVSNESGSFSATWRRNR